VNRWGVAALAVLIAGSLAAAVGGATALVVFSVNVDECEASGDVLCGLGWAVFALLGGLLAAIATYVVAGLVFIQRRLPSGKRAGPVLVLLCAPLVVTMALGLLSTVVESLV
jgi:hypothetical protein